MTARFEVRPLGQSILAATPQPLYVVWDTVRDTRVTTIPAWMTERLAQEDADKLNAALEGGESHADKQS